MICDQLSSLLGFECHPLTDDGAVVLVQTPFKFDDGDAMPVFVEMVNGQVRFFDDGATLRHFLGRGARIENKKHASFLAGIANKHSAAFSDQGEIESWSSQKDASQAFSSFMCTMLAVASWEKEQGGQDTDTSIFVEEVALALRAWKPSASITTDPEFDGVSGKRYKLDFLLDGQPVAVTGAHANSVSALLHRLLDIHGKPTNDGFRPMVIIDDRADPAAAKRESSIIQNISTVMQFSDISRPHAYPS